MAELSPMMQNYFETKEKYKDSILFYRLGDFYEMFFDDAITASRELEITLTGRACGLEEKAPMCGVPFHAAEMYISRLIQKGYKVAICEQLEDPKKTKGIVKRDVIRVITPGTVIETNMLDEKKNNYIMAIAKQNSFYGIAVCDVSTGDFYATQITQNHQFEKLLDEFARYMPSEIVINPVMEQEQKEIDQIKERSDVFVSVEEETKFANNDTLKNYQILNSKSEPIEDLALYPLSIFAINGLLSYLSDTQKISLEHMNTIKIYEIQKYMALDIHARRNLELTERMRDKTKKGSLIWVLDKTATSMGGRLLRRWVNDPLVDIYEIQSRLDAVEELKDNLMLRGELIEVLRKVYDMERLAGKISYGNANARDLNSLKSSLSKLPEVKEILSQFHTDMLKQLYEDLDVLEDIEKLIDRAIVEEPPISIKEGGIIKKGYHTQIDEYRSASIEGKNWIIDIETKEKEKTGIKNLKVGYTRLFGYYIEVTKSFLNQVPEYFIRKQTLANAERFITEELKAIEDKILGAEEKVIDLEYQEFVKIREEIGKNVRRLQTSANIVATLDCLNSLAIIADEYEYVKPQITTDGVIDIQEGRHPVIEKILPTRTFVENDTVLNTKDIRTAIITGPNMAGKSTYMRQVALITLMAQIGSFVPAKEAKIGIVDKIFTRVGASDDLSMGQSTFMVEMMEVANILNEATEKSLVILDEIGRGTSTYDGMSIAWAVAEYMNESIGCKTLFATHYHELTQLEGKLEGIKNYSVAVKEKGEDVIFLRKIIEGGTDESYGIHVAKLAGVPKVVTTKANKILKSLERTSKKINDIQEDKKKVDGQLDFYNYKLADIGHELEKIDLNEITPIDAFNTLMKMKEMMED